MRNSVINTLVTQGLQLAPLFLLAALPVLVNAVFPTETMGSWAWVLYAGPFIAGVGPLLFVVFINHTLAKETREMAPISTVWPTFRKWSRLERWRWSFWEILAPATAMAFLSTILVGSIAAVAIASTLYDLAIIKRLYFSFGAEFGFMQAVLYFLDQVIKAVFFDVAEILGLSLPHGLQTPKGDYFFTAILLFFRTSVSIIVVGSMTALIGAAWSRFKAAD